MGGSACLRSGRATDIQGPSVPHRPRPVDVGRSPCTSDREEQESRHEPQVEAGAAPRRRTSSETPSVPSRSAEQVLPSKTTGRLRSVERVTSQALGIAPLAPHSSPLPSKTPGRPRSVESVTSQALGIAALTPHSNALTSKTPGRPRSAERIASQPVDSAAFSLDPSTSKNSRSSALQATQLRSSPSSLPGSGPDEGPFETHFLPHFPLLSDPARTRVMATNENAACELFPVPRPQDGTLDFSLAPAFFAAVATNEDSAWNFSADVSFNTTVRGSDAFGRPF